jgi:hypothetical protein
VGGLLFLHVVFGLPAFAQAPIISDKPGASEQPPGVPGEQAPPTQPPIAVTPETRPLPVIPSPQLIPPSTVSSAPVPVLPIAPFDLLLSTRFRLVPTLTVSEEYTDNFNLTDRNKQSNFRSTVSPGLQVLINSAFTKGVIAYNFAPAYDTATGEFQYFHSLLGQVTWEATPRWRLTVADTFTQSDQPSQADALGLRQERQTFKSNTLSLSSDYLIGTVLTRQSYVMSMFFDDVGGDTTSHTLAATASVPLYQTNSILVGYDYLTSSTTGGSPTSGTLLASSNTSDTSGHQFSVGVSRQITPLRTVGLRGSYALRSFEDDTGDTDYSLWNVSGFFTTTLAGRLRLSTSLGVSGLIIDPGGSLGPNFFTTTSLSYQFARAILTLSANQGFSETFSSGQNFGVVETSSYAASLSYPFTPSLSGTATGFFQRNSGTGIGNVDTGQDNEEESWGGTLDFSLRLSRTMHLGLGYSYLRHSGDNNQVSGFTRSTDYTENRVRASLGIAF